jgi:Nucleotide-diphospho-sugar transferase
MDILFISVFNCGALKMALNHLTSLKNQGITNYMAYVTDRESYDVLIDKGFNATIIDNAQITKDKCDFATGNFNEISYIRYNVIHMLLLEGKTVWYMDIDTVILHDVREFYYSMKLSGIDLAFQNDVNMLCSGCMVFFPTVKALDFALIMSKNKRNDYNDQIIVNNILRKNPSFYKIYVFDMNEFPNGLLYFNPPDSNPNYRELQEQFSSSSRDVYFVHANWMIGLDVKMKAFKSKNLWFIDE